MCGNLLYFRLFLRFLPLTSPAKCKIQNTAVSAHAPYARLGVWFLADVAGRPLRSVSLDATVHYLRIFVIKLKFVL